MIGHIIIKHTYLRYMNENEPIKMKVRNKIIFKAPLFNNIIKLFMFWTQIIFARRDLKQKKIIGWNKKIKFDFNEVEIEFNYSALRFFEYFYCRKRFNKTTRSF